MADQKNSPADQLDGIMADYGFVGSEGPYGP